MLHKELNVQVCDATEDEQREAADQIKAFAFANALNMLNSNFLSGIFFSFLKFTCKGLVNRYKMLTIIPWCT